MNLINNEGNDLSEEGYIYLAAILEMAYALQIMGFRLSGALDKIGARGCLVQKKKAAFSAAQRNATALVNGLDVAFDKTFSDLYDKPDGLKRADRIHANANELARLALIFITRGNGDPEKRDRMQKALLNFKQDDAIDVREILRFHDSR